MPFEVDQSGRVEETNRATVVAFSNNEKGTIIFSSREKQLLFKYFQQKGKRKLFGPLIFAVLLHLLMKNSVRPISELIIDLEYPGYEKMISELLGQFFQRDRLKIKPEISFRPIGKKSAAHRIAFLAYKSGRADKKVMAKEILRYIKP